jgi:hypothetical protein
MTAGDRKQWLYEINRIHTEEQKQREKEVMRQALAIAQLRQTMDNS